MNKNLICFGGGLAIGIGATYLYLRDYYNKLLDSETEKIKNYYDEKVQNLAIVELTKDIEKEFDEAPKVPKSGKNEVKKGIVAPVEPNYDEIVEKLNYNQFSTKPKSYDNIVEDNSENKIEGPYPISYELYADTAHQYTTTLVSYFVEDDILMYCETDEIMDDPGKLIGYDNLSDFRNGDEVDERYIRNDYLGIDFHIIREEGSYEDYLAE